MSERFMGKTAIITGASRGIGLAIAQRLVDEGAKVVVTGRDKAALDEAVEQLGGSGRAIGVAGNADDSTHQGSTVRHATEAFGSVDLLVNNAGISPVYGPMIELDLGAARKILEVNCLAALSWAQHAHRAWMGEHGGAIVNVSSVTGVRPSAGIGMYGASKAMLSSMTELLALELGPDIRVNAVAPAVVRTKLAGPLYEGRESDVASIYPLKRIGESEDVGSLVAFLLAPESGWITGQTVVIDGGLTVTGGVE